MRKILLLTILLSIAFGQSPQQSANLKMPDGYKTINLYIDIDDKLDIVSESTVLSALKLRLRQNGIKYHAKNNFDEINGTLVVDLFIKEQGNNAFIFTLSLLFSKPSMMSIGGEVAISRVGDMINRGKVVHQGVIVYETPRTLGLYYKKDSTKKVLDIILRHVDKFSADFLDVNDL